MENIRAVLERHGSSLDRAVKVTVMLADINEWPAMNREYVEFFPTHFSARSAFGTIALMVGVGVADTNDHRSGFSRLCPTGPAPLMPACWTGSLSIEDP